MRSTHQQRPVRFRRGTPAQTPVDLTARFVYRQPHIATTYDTAGTIERIKMDAAVQRRDEEKVLALRMRGRGFGTQYPARVKRSIFSSANTGGLELGRQEWGAYGQERVFNKDYRDPTGGLWQASKSAMTGRGQSGTAGRLHEGERVHARLKGRRRLYMATVTRCRTDGTFDVLFDEGCDDDGGGTGMGQPPKSTAAIGGTELQQHPRALIVSLGSAEHTTGPKARRQREARRAERMAALQRHTRRRYHHTDVTFDVSSAGNPCNPRDYHSKRPYAGWKPWS